MNEAERMRFLEALRQDEDCRAAVRREHLSEELLNLSQTVSVLVDAVAAQRQDFIALAQSVANYMERTISAVQDGFSSARGEIAGLRTDVDTEFSSVRGEIAGLRTDMETGFTSISAKFDAEFDHVDGELEDIKRQLAS